MNIAVMQEKIAISNKAIKEDLWISFYQN
jgi:hypothetical protein